MDSLVKVYVRRSENEFRLAKSLLILSGNEDRNSRILMIQAEIDAKTQESAFQNCQR